MRAAVAEPRFGQFAVGRSRPMMALVEITKRCDMDCPMCFWTMNAQPGQKPQ